MNTRERIISLLEELKECKNIDCLDIKFGSTGLSRDISIDFYNALNHEYYQNKLPEDYIDFIHLGDDFEVHWKSKDKNISGEFDLVSVSVFLFRGSNGEQLWNDGMSEVDIEFYKNLRTIDIHSFSGGGQYTAIEFSKEGFPFTFWFINRDAKFKLNLDYGEYIDALIETRGLHGWQYFYLSDYESLKKNDYDLNRAKALMENTLIGLEKLFPDVNVTTYQKKYDELYN